jgi:peptide/nickel transport system ATP-binding protein
MAAKTILEVRNLVTRFSSRTGVVHAVRDVSFSLAQGEVLGLVGESGCGKTVTSLSLIRLIPTPPGKIVQGEVLLEGEDLLKKNNRALREIRGSRVSMIFQDPMTSLDPVFPVGMQIGESLRTHLNLGGRERQQRILEILETVRIANPQRIAGAYSYQLSGGMRQRVMIAIALACNPHILLADEPTTALDVTIQAEIIDLLRDMVAQRRMSVILITHNLGVISEIADRVAVMYAGQIVEYCSVKEIFTEPLHPYTRGLLAAIPRINSTGGRLSTIEGAVPDMRDPPATCSFLPRCSRRIDRCSREPVSLLPVSGAHHVRCHLYGAREQT